MMRCDESNNKNKNKKNNKHSLTQARTSFECRTQQYYWNSVWDCACILNAIHLVQGIAEVAFVRFPSAKCEYIFFNFIRDSGVKELLNVIAYNFFCWMLFLS